MSRSNSPKKKKKSRPIGHFLEFVAFVALLFTVRLIPHFLAIRMGHALGWMAACVVRLRRRVVDENLVLAFGDTKSQRERDRIARGAYMHFGVMAVEALRLYGRPLTKWNELIDPDGSEEIRAVHKIVEKYGNELVLLTAHLGFWEMSNTLAFQGIRLCHIAKPIHNPYLEGMIVKGRKYPDYRTITTQESMGKMVRAAKEGWALGLVADQDARKQGIFVNFFGRPASTPIGPAFFASKLNRPLIPYYYIRMANGKFRLFTESPIIPPEGLDADEAIRYLTQKGMDSLEMMIRRYPEQYWWFHRRWKTQPPTFPETPTAS